MSSINGFQYHTNNNMFACQNRNIQGPQRVRDVNAIRSNGFNTLGPNEFLKASNVTAKYQDDGNFLIYKSENGQNTLIWHSGTFQYNPGYALIQEDGNLVLYDGQGLPYWNLGTGGRPRSDGPFSLVLEQNNISVRNRNNLYIWYANF